MRKVMFSLMMFGFVLLSGFVNNNINNIEATISTAESDYGQLAIYEDLGLADFQFVRGYGESVACETKAAIGAVSDRCFATKDKAAAEILESVVNRYSTI